MLMTNFYRNKKVLITGHSGFKGAWLTHVLNYLGATVIGYSLPAPDPSLFVIAHARELAKNYFSDIRDFDSLLKCFKENEPDIVIHMAAQPLVLESYLDPKYTYETNVMGTVNVLECVRLTKSVKSFLNVTTDKVYKNREWCWGYRECEDLNGFDPYSNSKSCSELVTESYKNCFFQDREIGLSTARAGNVIGGGDFSTNRIIPDCIRAQIKHEKILVRNPNSIRPYQHVLEPLNAYLMIMQYQYGRYDRSTSYNVGPNEEDCIRTGDLVELFCKEWNMRGGKAIWQSNAMQNQPHEANFLKLDCSYIKQRIGWYPRIDIQTAVDMVCDWSLDWMAGKDVREVMNKQIWKYFHEA